MPEKKIKIQWKKWFLKLVKGDLLKSIPGGICPADFRDKRCEIYVDCEACWEDNLRRWQAEESNQS